MRPPIKVKEALSLIDMALHSHGAVTPRDLERALTGATPAPAECIALSVATFPMALEYIRHRISSDTFVRDEIDELYDSVYGPVSVLRDHYDKCQPDWRKSGQ